MSRDYDPFIPGNVAHLLASPEKFVSENPGGECFVQYPPPLVIPTSIVGLSIPPLGVSKQSSSPPLQLNGLTEMPTFVQCDAKGMKLRKHIRNAGTFQH